MTKPKRQTKSKQGCFSCIIRRLLCTGNVPTHPSSSPSSVSDTKLKNPETKTPKPEPEPEPESKPKPGPNLVARLMGLDSLPPSIDSLPKKLSPDSFSRSRSVNFADYLLKFDPNNSLSHSHSQSHHHRHRRVKTSVSFREVPSGDFVVVYLGNDVSHGDQSKPEKEKIIKNNNINNNKKKKKKKEKNDNDKKRDTKISKLKNEPRRKVLPNKGKGKNGNGAKALGSVLANGDVKSKVLKKENEKKVTEIFSRKRKNQKSNSTENLSSVVSVIEEKHSTPVNSDLKTKTKSEPKTAYHCNDEFELRSIGKKTNYGNSTDNKDTLDFVQLAEQLLKLTKEDLSESYWICNTKNMRDFEDICIEFEKLILDVLLNEVTSEIVQIY